jgi:hypothetical protein
MIPLRLPFLPTRLNAKHPLLLENLLEFAESGLQNAVDSSIEMLSDFHQHDLQSRYLKKFMGLPFWELKTRSRGGVKGGVRIYLFIATNTAYCVNAEIKPSSQPDAAKLEEATMPVRCAYMVKKLLRFTEH